MLRAVKSLFADCLALAFPLLLSHCGSVMELKSTLIILLSSVR